MTREKLGSALNDPVGDEFAVSTTYGSQRGEIIKSNFTSQEEADNFATLFLNAQTKRIANEGGIVPQVAVWKKVRES